MYVKAKFYLKWKGIETRVIETLFVFCSPLDMPRTAVKDKFQLWLVNQQCGMMEEIEECNFKIL